jgi:hypothetical protein
MVEKLALGAGKQLRAGVHLGETNGTCDRPGFNGGAANW